MIDQLLETGANPNIQLKLLPPFARAARIAASTACSPPALRRCCAPPKLRMRRSIILLLKHGANPNLPNNQGITPTMAAAGLGSVDADTRGWYTTADIQERSIASLDAARGGGESTDAAAA